MSDVILICRVCSVEHKIQRRKVRPEVGMCPICEEYHALYPVFAGQPSQGDKRASDQDALHAQEATLDLSSKYNDSLFCPECGSSNKDPTEAHTWRWNGENWEHRCGGIDPQCGHFVIERADTVADAPRSRQAQKEETTT